MAEPQSRKRKRVDDDDNDDSIKEPCMLFCKSSYDASCYICNHTDDATDVCYALDFIMTYLSEMQTKDSYLKYIVSIGDEIMSMNHSLIHNDVSQMDSQTREWYVNTIASVSCNIETFLNTLPADIKEIRYDYISKKIAKMLQQLDKAISV